MPIETLQAKVANEDAAFHVTVLFLASKATSRGRPVRCSPLSTISVSPVKLGVATMKRNARTRSSVVTPTRERIGDVLLGEARVGLAAAAQREAGRDARHAQPRREAWASKLRQALQARSWTACRSGNRD